MAFLMSDAGDVLFCTARTSSLSGRSRSEHLLLNFFTLEDGSDGPAYFDEIPPLLAIPVPLTSHAFLVLDNDCPD